MGKVRTIRARVRERGIALLISIFILLLISIVAIALIVASGTESALAGNYRSSTGVYYAALAGLEEARGRLVKKNPNAFNNTLPGYFPGAGGALPIGTVLYVLNPSPTDNVATMLTTYPDTEYDSEFGAGKLVLATVTTTSSVWNMAPLNGLGIPGPLYKWVRINPISEVSLKLNVFPFTDPNDAVASIFYDGTRLNVQNLGQQVLEVTSLAVLPNGSQKIVQYLVAPVPLSLPPFLAAITFAGNPANVNPIYRLNYGAPDSTSWYVDGRDSFRHSASDTPTWSCTPSGPTVYALGYTNPLDNSYGYIHCCQVTASANKHNYIGPGSPLTDPDVQQVTMPPTLQTPTDYNNLVQSITQNADVLITPVSGTASGSDLTPLGMNSSNPLTVVIQGDLDLTSWHNQGYGLLLVTGNLNYDPDASWYGIVMVIGKGTVTGSHAGSGEFDGATLLVQTVDPATGNPLASLGGANMQYDDHMGGLGYYYSSCWINNSIPAGSYKILSFHEISQ